MVNRNPADPQFLFAVVGAKGVLLGGIHASACILVTNCNYIDPLPGILQYGFGFYT